ncbi:hypothetical protein D046_5614D, partial [Vibrio parahaemolyticus V-223/04]
SATLRPQMATLSLRW